jgi:hypothetical protein
MDESVFCASRRRLLAAGLGGVAAAAATLAKPLGVAALTTPMLTETDNASTANTGISNSDAAANAVGFAASVAGAGTGLSGSAPTGVGVLGQSTSAGAGVRGTSTSGIGVHASAPTTGVALQVTGRAKFSRSGRATVSAGQNHRTVTLAGVTTSSLVIATLRTRRTGVYVAAAVPSSGKFTIYLNKAVSAATYVAYFVLN